MLDKKLGKNHLPVLAVWIESNGAPFHLMVIHRLPESDKLLMSSKTPQVPMMILLKDRTL